MRTHRAKKSVEVQVEWADQRGREDLDDTAWADARAATKNTNLEAYAAARAKSDNAKTPDGRCEKALQIWLQRRSTWAGSCFSSKSQLPWLWYVQKLLPRYHTATKAWRKPRRHITVKSYLQNYRFVRRGVPTRVHRISAQLWSARGRLSKGKVAAKHNRYGIMAYCETAAVAIKIIFGRLLAFHDPEVDDPTTKPQIVWAASIVLGSSMVNQQLESIRARNGAKVKPNVFTRALEVFGSSGPTTCHPFARQYGILQAVFSHHEPHPTADPELGLKQAKFTVTHPTDPTMSTAATLTDSRTLPANVQAGDVLRMEVVSSSPSHAVLSVPRYIGFVKKCGCNKPTIILAVEALGFVHVRTEKFVVRPHAAECILQLSRHYFLATVAKSRGATNNTGLFGCHDLLFTCEEGNLHQYLLDHQLDDTNSFILDVIDSRDHENISSETLCISRYSKKNSKDE